MDSDTNKTPDWIRLSPELEHFDPFEGLVDLSSSDEKNIRYGYKVCDLNLLFDQTIPCEIIRSYSIYPIPNTHEWIRGLINHRGNLIPVFDLHALWSFKTRDETNPLVIFDHGGQYVAIYLDAFPIALDFDNAKESSFDQTSNIPSELSLFIKSIYSIESTIWSEVDFRGFMRYITKEYSEEEIQDDAL